MVGPLFSLNLSICWSLLIPAPWEASSRARRRADHGVAVNRAVDRIKIRLILSEDRGDAAADPPAWTSNIGCHAIDAENFHTATHSLYSASHWPSVRVSDS